MSRLRYVALLTIVILAGVGTLLISARSTPPLPSPQPETTAAPLHSYLIDVAGWYEITPNEAAVSSAIDFSIDDLKELPQALGRWKGEPITLGAEVNEWFENPDLALSNLYRDERGNQIWFSVFGSKSSKSYFLFEHTPITSYPAAGWTLVENGVAPVPIGSSRIFVQKATLTKDRERRVVFYWYLWSDINRDPEQGVLTMRLHIPVVTTDEDAVAAGADFLRTVFPQVISWHRF
jgi:Protein of unknown function (DUF3485)